MNDFAAVPGEPQVITARRLIAALRYYRHLTRRDLQGLLYPGDTYDVRCASHTGALLTYCADRGWIRKYGRQFLPTVAGLKQLDLAEGVQPMESA